MRATERIPCPRLSPSSWRVSFCCHIQSIIDTAPGSLPWDCSCGASRDFCCNREGKLGWHRSSMWTWSAFKWSSNFSFPGLLLFPRTRETQPMRLCSARTKLTQSSGNPPKSSMLVWKVPKKSRDAPLLSVSLGSASAGAGLTEGATLRGLDYWAHTEGASATSVTDVDQNYRGGCSAMWGSFLPPLIW